MCLEISAVFLTDIKRIHGLSYVFECHPDSNDIADVVDSVAEVARCRTVSTFLLRAARASSPTFKSA